MSELDKLEKYLKEHGIIYERNESHSINPITGEDCGLNQIVVYKNRKRFFDAICNRGSDGFEQGLLEIYGDIVDVHRDHDSVVGWLTAKDVIERMVKHDQTAST